MIIHRVDVILYFFLFTWLYSEDCTCCITEEYFNENILSYHISMLDENIVGSQALMYKYGLNTDCPPGIYYINIEYKIYAPEIGITTYETFYNGRIDIDNTSYFTNHDIEPGSGFGTGSHPTTQLCIQWMETHLISGVSVLDYGCGSGILSIVAKIFGAKKIIGVDNDDQALRNAERNRDLNSVDIELLHTSNYQDIIKFDIVIANILLKTIISLKEKLLASLNVSGKLLLTGILKDQAIEIISAFSPEIRLNIISEKEGWLLLYGENN